MKRETLLAAKLVKRRASSGDTIGLWISPSGEPIKLERGKSHNNYVVDINNRLVLSENDPEGVWPMEKGWGRVRLFYGEVGNLEANTLTQEFVDVIVGLAIRNLVRYWIIKIKSMGLLQCINDDIKKVSTPEDVVRLGFSHD